MKQQENVPRPKGQGPTIKQPPPKRGMATIGDVLKAKLRDKTRT